MAGFESIKENFPFGLKILSDQGEFEHIISSPLWENSGWTVQLFIKSDQIQDVLVRSTEQEEIAHELRAHMLTYVSDSLDGMSPSEAILSCLLESKMWLEDKTIKLASPPPTTSTSSASLPTPKPERSTSKTSTLTTNIDSKEKKSRMKTAEDVISRIQWDERLPERHFIVGYLDRFTGVIEKPFSDFCWDDYVTVDDINVLAVPRHRIQYFKYKSVIVWDKRNRTDLVFGSATPQQVDIYEVIKKEDEKSGFLQDTETEETATADDLNEFPINEELDEAEKSADVSNRPTHYVSIRITSSSICEKVTWVQESLETNFPGCCKKVVPLNYLHITLALVRPSSAQQQEDIKEKLAVALDSERSTLVQMCQQINPDGVQLKGLILLGERIVAGQLNEAKLKPLQNHISNALRRAGFNVELPQTLHLTIAKLNTVRSRSVLARVVETLQVSRFSGSQPVINVALRAMRSGALVYEINSPSE